MGGIPAKYLEASIIQKKSNTMLTNDTLPSRPKLNNQQNIHVTNTVYKEEQFLLLSKYRASLQITDIVDCKGNDLEHQDQLRSSPDSTNSE